MEQQVIFTMTSFHYCDQNLSGFRFLLQIRTFVIQTSLGLSNLNMKGETKTANQKDCGYSSTVTPSCK